MKLTLDRMCIQTGNLCATCQKKLDEGEISELDIDFGKILLNLAKSNKYLNDLQVVKILPISSKVFVIVKKDQREKLVRAKDQIKENLDQLENREFVFVEKIKNIKVLIDSLLLPIKVLSHSIVILPPDGEKELKISIKKSDKDRMTLSTEETSKLTMSLLNMNSHFVYVSA